MSRRSLNCQQRVFKRYHSRVLPTRWRRKPAGLDVNWHYVTVTVCRPIGRRTRQHSQTPIVFLPFCSSLLLQTARSSLEGVVFLHPTTNKIHLFLRSCRVKKSERANAKTFVVTEIAFGRQFGWECGVKRTPHRPRRRELCRVGSGGENGCKPLQ